MLLQQSSNLQKPSLSSPKIFKNYPKNQMSATSLLGPNLVEAQSGAHLEPTGELSSPSERRDTICNLRRRIIQLNLLKYRTVSECCPADATRRRRTKECPSLAKFSGGPDVSRQIRCSKNVLHNTRSGTGF